MTLLHHMEAVQINKLKLKLKLKKDMFSKQFWAFPVVTAKCKETQKSLWLCPANYLCGGRLYWELFFTGSQI